MILSPLIIILYSFAILSTGLFYLVGLQFTQASTAALLSGHHAIWDIHAQTLPTYDLNLWKAIIGGGRDRNLDAL